VNSQQLVFLQWDGWVKSSRVAYFKSDYLHGEVVRTYEAEL